MPENQKESAPRRIWRMVAAALIVAAGASFLAVLEYVTFSDEKATQRDFIEYWVIGQQLTRGANPYDLSAIAKLERRVGLGEHAPRISLSPPTMLFPMLPLGLVRAKTGFIAWTFLEIGCLSISTWLLWRLNGRPDNRIHLFGYAFAPAVVCVTAGQLSVFLLLGIVLFLYFHQARPILAGAALLPCTLKPQLFLVFAAVILVWVVATRSFRVLLGFLAALIASCAVTLHFDANVWSEYLGMMRESGILRAFIPTLGVALRFAINPNVTALQLIPAIVGSVWAVWYFLSRRERWNWMDQGLFLLVISDVCAPYGFFTDECILLPFVLSGLYRAAKPGRWLSVLAVINGIALIEVFAQVNIISPYYLWTLPAWLAWYICATWRKRPGSDGAGVRRAAGTS